jgi:hypothetical protein
VGRAKCQGPAAAVANNTTMVVMFVGWSAALVSRESVLFLREQTYDKVDNEFILYKISKNEWYTYCYIVFFY